MISLILALLLVLSTVGTTVGFVLLPTPSSSITSLLPKRIGSCWRTSHHHMSRRPIQSQKNVSSKGSNRPNHKKSKNTQEAATGTTSRRQPKGKPRNSKSRAKSTRTFKGRRTALWETMYPKLKAYYDKHGHSFVMPDDDNHQELYEWTRYLRRYYCGDNSPKGNNKEADAMFVDDPNITSLTPQQRLKLLQDIEFCWDYRSMMWEIQYKQLVQFYEKHGHTRVSRCRHDKKLATFCSNQRREYRKLLQSQEDAEVGDNLVVSTTLTPERLEKLNRIKFFDADSYKTHEEKWHERYDQLKEYKQMNGDPIVPQKYELNFPLGQWCMNQRIHYQYYVTKQATGMNLYRIHQLESVGFPLRYQQYRWMQKFDRLQEYQRQHGHLQIDNEEDKDLRQWLNLQRHLYNRLQRQKQYTDQVDPSYEVSSSLTQERIDKLESIPNFSWDGRRKEGPSKDDWSKLFVAIREKGIVPGSRAKTHMFDGMNPFHMDVQRKDVWTEADLLALWNSEDDDDDDEDHIDGQQSYGVLSPTNDSLLPSYRTDRGT